MSPGRSWRRLQGYYQRRAASLLFRRPFMISTRRPVISFTFDDFTQSAVLIGGAILNHFDLAGTYYASLGVIGKELRSGRIFGWADLRLIHEQGHELGCHTVSHCHSWESEA